MKERLMKENVVFFFWVAEIWGSCNQFCWYYEIQRKELFFIRDVLKISPRRGRKSGRNVVGGGRKDRKEGCCRCQVGRWQRWRRRTRGPTKERKKICQRNCWNCVDCCFCWESCFEGFCGFSPNSNKRLQFKSIEYIN